MFSVVLEIIFWKLEVRGEFLNHLRFPVVIVLFANNATDLRLVIDNLSKERKEVGLS